VLTYACSAGVYDELETSRKSLVALLEILLDHGADMNASGSRGKTPLQLLVGARKEGDKVWDVGAAFLVSRDALIEASTVAQALARGMCWTIDVLKHFDTDLLFNVWTE
jgi:hypothetical protein